MPDAHRQTAKAGIFVGLLVSAYLALPVLMWWQEGFLDGFLPALLWPFPVMLFLMFCGLIPLWAGEFGVLAFTSVWLGEIVSSIAAGRLAQRLGETPGSISLGVYFVFGLANVVLWCIFGRDLS